MAVIAALVVVAVVAVIAAGISVRQAAFLRTAHGEQLRARTQLLARDGFAQALATLHVDAQQHATTGLDDPWAAPLRQAHLASAATAGEVALRIEDEQGKFNLRNLVRNGQVDADEVASFGRLCAALGVQPALAARIVERASASVAQVAVAGQDETAGQGAADRVAVAARQPLPRTLDDLAALPGIDQDVLARLRPFVTVLPENTWLNGNTAGAEVIGANVPELPPARIRALLQERDRGHRFVNRGDFVNRLRLPDPPLERIRITIVSQWFRISGNVTVDGTSVPVQALIRRSVRSGRTPRIVWSRIGA